MFVYAFCPIFLIIGYSAGGGDGIESISNRPEWTEKLSLLLSPVIPIYWIMMPLSFRKRWTNSVYLHYLCFMFTFLIGYFIDEQPKGMAGMGVFFTPFLMAAFILIGVVLLYFFRSYRKTKNIKPIFPESNAKWFLTFVIVSVITIGCFKAYADATDDRPEDSTPCDYIVNVVNDTPDIISLRSFWGTEQHPYERTRFIARYSDYIPETETIRWSRKEQKYSETIHINELLKEYSKTEGELSYIIKEDDSVLVRYEVNEDVHFLIDNPKYKKPREDNCALIDTIESNDINNVNEMILNGFKVNAESFFSKQPLHTAVENNFYEITELLLKHGAKIEGSIYHGPSALNIACRNGNFRIAKLLIDGGANINYEYDCPLVGGIFCQLPLHIAVERNFYEITELLLKHDAKIESPIHFGPSALTIACRNSNLRIAKLLIDSGANINYEHDCPLSEMCKIGNYDVAKFLIENGAKTNPPMEMSRPPMACAIMSENAKMVKLLMENGVSLDTSWKYQTFRSYAIKYGGEDIAKLIQEENN